MRRKIHNSKMVVFGDSITEGIGVPEGAKKWTEIIKERFNLELINSGVGGNTSSQGLLRIQEDVLVHNPDFVTICFGMNDHCMISNGVPNVPLKTFMSNIISMIEAVRNKNAVPLLVTPNYITEGDKSEYYYSRHDPGFYTEVGGAQDWLDRYIDIIREISRVEAVGLIDVRKECGNYNCYDFLRSLKNSNFTDGVHPHTLGAKVYANVIGDYLEANFG